MPLLLPLAILANALRREAFNVRSVNFGFKWHIVSDYVRKKAIYPQSGVE
jgi:hypothetical protein